ncbi:MAG: DUF1579 family protein [Planctomycetota bacterium]
MPRATAEHRRLEALVGSWSGEETMHPSPWDSKGGTAKGRIETRVGLDGFVVISDYVQERNGTISFRGHAVYSWDAGELCYLMYWFDSMSGAPRGPARGTWEGDTLLFEDQSPMGRSRYRYCFDEADSYGFAIEHRQDGENWMTFMDARYQRD